MGSLAWYEAVEERSDERVAKLRAWRKANGLEREPAPTAAPAAKPALDLDETN